MLSVEPTIEIEAGRADDKETREIYRNLQVLYGTVAGEQALDRDFGIDANVTDFPTEAAESFLATEYVRKTMQYEPRAHVSYVDFNREKYPNGIFRPKVVIDIV